MSSTAKRQKSTISPLVVYNKQYVIAKGNLYYEDFKSKLTDRGFRIFDTNNNNKNNNKKAYF